MLDRLANGAGLAIERELGRQLEMRVCLGADGNPISGVYGWTPAFRTRLAIGKACLDMLLERGCSDLMFVRARARILHLIYEVWSMEDEVRRGRVGVKGSYCIFVSPEKRAEMTRRLMGILSP